MERSLAASRQICQSHVDDQPHPRQEGVTDAPHDEGEKAPFVSTEQGQEVEMGGNESG